MTEFSATRAAQFVATFDGSGVHRVGTPGDFASGDWLAAEAAAAGAQVARMPVTVNRTVIEEAYVEVGNQRIDGLPMFDSPPTRADGIAEHIVPNGRGREIGYLDLPPNSASIKGMRFELIRRETRHSALVVATRVIGESLAPINAQYYNAPFGPPALLVAGAQHALLTAHAQERAAAKIVSLHRREPAQSFNVVANIGTMAPTGTAKPPLVVVTPRTGWWESTAERAGGLVAWLAAIGAAAEHRDTLRCNVHAFATCGHELGHLGLTELVSRETALIRGAQHILHLGANLGCASDRTLFLRAADPTMAEHMHKLLCSEGYPEESIRMQPISTVSGEGRDLAEHGAQVLSMAGANAHFHAASDRWPGNVNAAGTAAIARAVARWVKQTAAQ